MAADFPIRAKVDDKELDRLIAKLKQTGKQADMSEKQIDEMAASVKKSAKTSTKEINGINSSLDKMPGSLKNIAAGFGVAFIATKVLEMGKALQENVKRLEAIDTRATVVFGKYKKLVDEVAATTANSLGLSRAEFTASTAAAADLLVPMQFARKEATTMSIELIKLSGALSEWTGGQKSSTEVSDILTKALLGEREQLKTLGIAISEFDVQARLAEKGQQKLTGTALQQAKALATLELITEKSTDAQTAFAQGADTTGRAAAETDAALKDIADTLSEVFAPAVASVTKGLRDMIVSTKTATEALSEFITSDSISFWEKLGAIFDQTGTKALTLAARSEGLKKAQEEATEVVEEEVKAVERQIPLLEKLGNQLKQLKDDREQALTPQQLAFANRNIELIEFEIKRLKELGTIQKQIVPPTLDFRNAKEEADKFLAAIEAQFGDGFFPDLEAKNKEALDSFDKTMDAMAKANKDRLDKQKADEEKHQEAVAELREAFVDFGVGLLNNYFDHDRMKADERLSRLSEQRNTELTLAGDNEEAKAAINKKFDQDEKKLKREQAKREQDYALYEIAIQTGIAAAKSIAASPVTFGQPFLTFAIAQGLLQATLVKTAPLPKFAKGIYGLDGPGTETSDNIPAMLSKNESVVPAHRSKPFGWLLKPMIEDSSFDERKLRQLIDARTPSHLRGDIMVVKDKGTASDPELKAGLKAIEKAVKSQRVGGVRLDGDGFFAVVNKSLSTTEFFTKRYSS